MLYAQTTTKGLLTAIVVSDIKEKNAAKAHGSVFLLSPSITHVGTPRHSARRQAGGISCYSAIGSSSTNSRHLRNSRLFLFRGSTRGILPYLSPAPRVGTQGYSPSSQRIDERASAEENLLSLCRVMRKSRRSLQRVHEVRGSCIEN